MIIINVIGLLLIGLIVWWFWLYKSKDIADTQTDEVTIVVNDGVYKPSRIKVAAGKAVTLNFLRKSENPCSETVVFPEQEISQELPLGTATLVSLPEMEAGEYPFHCPMKMYVGTLVVES